LRWQRGTSTESGKGGYPNGGGISGDVYSGGGGGRSEVDINGIILAIAGGGSGGTGYSSNGGAGGGNVGQDGNCSNSGGTQTAGGISTAGYPTSNFILSGSKQGAGSTSSIVGLAYDTGGGGDGFYGGGVCGGDAKTSGGGSGYVNTAFPGYRSSFDSVASGTYTGNRTALPPEALNFTQFSDGSGVGKQGIAKVSGASGVSGGNGKVVVQFL
jgi:hypothetical protein